MLQTIAGKSVYVVEFDTMPELPITGLTEEEAKKVNYERILDKFMHSPLWLSINRPKKTDGDYAKLLTGALAFGLITEPGKYGLHIDHENHQWNVFKIVE